MGAFSGIEKTSSSTKLPHIKPGRYLLEVQAVKHRKSAMGSDSFFITEFKVLAAEGAEANEVGSEVSHVVKLGQPTSLGNVKGVVSAIIAEPESAVTEEVVEGLVEDDRDARGIRVQASAYLTKTRKGSDFTLIRYRPSDGSNITLPPEAGETSSTGVPF